jgi:hypothetical protein
MERIKKHCEINESGCWLWTACKTRDGYAEMKYEGKTCHCVHRLHWVLSGRTIPDGHVIRHMCKNRNCVALDHLQTGTLTENQLDRHRDGTMNSKLTEEQVREIKTCTDTNKSLAEKFGVDPSCISKIRTGRGWKWVTT